MLTYVMYSDKFPAPEKNTILVQIPECEQEYSPLLRFLDALDVFLLLLLMRLQIKVTLNVLSMDPNQKKSGRLLGLFVELSPGQDLKLDSAIFSSVQGVYNDL